MEVREILQQMTVDTAFNTDSTYSPNTNLYPDKTVTFVEQHMAYLEAHHAVRSGDYIANLRLKTRLR